MLRPTRLTLIFTLLLSVAVRAQQGQELYQVFCASCHMADRFHVGPSLIEIGKLYGDKPDEFVAWCHAPKQKRKGVIQMPSMAHVDAPKPVSYTHLTLPTSR